MLTAILDLYQEEVRKAVRDLLGHRRFRIHVQQQWQEGCAAGHVHPAHPGQRHGRYKLQPTPKGHVHVVIPFSDTPGRSPSQPMGNDPAVLSTLMDKIIRIHLGSGTDMYAGIVAALTYIKQHQEDIKGHFPAIAVLSDGQSEGNIDSVKQEMETALGNNAVKKNTVCLRKNINAKRANPDT